jgi:hypothetical protein
VDKLINAWTVKHTAEEAEKILQKPASPQRGKKAAEIIKTPMESRKYLTSLSIP